MSDASESERAARAASLPSIRVSVVVPVYHRSGQLRRLLGALAGQTFPKEQMEVLICDDGSTEDLAEVLGEFEDRLTFSLCQAHWEQAGRETRVPPCI